jgi:hypothetical protein
MSNCLKSSLLSVLSTILIVSGLMDGGKSQIADLQARLDAKEAMAESRLADEKEEAKEATKQALIAQESARVLVAELEKKTKELNEKMKSCR